MSMKKFFCRALTIIFFIGIFFALPTVHAEIKTFEGIGEAVMEENKTLDATKEEAKTQAERDAAEKFSVYVESQTDVKNSEVQHDEVVVMTESIIKVMDVKYKLLPVGDEFIVRAFVTAEFDTDEINKLLAKKREQG